ncbi:hypothetical protein [Streptosporangium sp. NPDC000396]|uniref:hypothetical protein n=1 Tax=Streptosporangium sp. NPDC000396 TaxID=3366185 RepID=UPI00368428D5
MSKFAEELRARVDEVVVELRRERAAMDDHGVEVLTRRLENLLRIAEQHGIDIQRPIEGTA